MPQSRLASVKLTPSTNQTVYTVPAGKTLVGSVFVRNFNETSSTVIDMSHTQDTLAADYTEAQLSSNTTNFTTNPSVPFGAVDGVSMAQGGRLTGDYSANQSFGNQYSFWDQSTDTTYEGVYNTQFGSSEYILNNSYMRGRYQISGFYTKPSDYYTVQQNRYPRRFKNYPWSYTTSGNFSDVNDNIAGGVNSDLDYYNWSNQGWNQYHMSMNDNGYVTYHYGVGETSFTGNKVNETNSSQSFYWQQEQLGGQVTRGSLSILPSGNRDSSKGMWYVTSGTWTTGQVCFQWMPVQNDDGSTRGSLSNNGRWYGPLTGMTTSADATWLWHRPVGDYVYAGAQSGKIYRSAFGTNSTQPDWMTQSNWSDVTSSFPANMNTELPFIETVDGFGYGATTSGQMVSSLDQGETWSMASTASITGITTTAGAQVGPKAANGSFSVYTADGLYTLAKAQRSNMEDAIELDLTLGKNGHLEHRGLILNAGDKIVVQSSQPDCVVDVYGYEE
jgi:hypothetical protein